MSYKEYPPPARPTPTYPSYAQSSRQPAPKAEMLARGPHPARDGPPTYHESRNGSAEWHTGLLGCLGAVDICCLACVCPCVQYSQNNRRLRALDTTGQPLRRGDGAGGMDGDGCVTYGLLTVVGCWGWVLGRGLRGSIRERYNIPGSAGEDCLTTFLCPPCALTQESLELAMEERRLRNASLQGSAAIYGLEGAEGTVEDPVGCGEVCCCCCRILGGGGRGCWW